MIVSTRKVTLRKEQDEGGGFKNARVLPTDRRHLEQQAKNIIKNFIRSGNSTEVLPPMPNDQRKVVHEYAQKNGILTKSHGKEPNRYMMLSLRQQQLTRANLTLTEPIIPNFRSLERIDSFIAAHPIRRADMVASYRQSASASSASSSSSNRSKTSIPVKSKCSAAMKKCRDTLPATKYRDTVIHAIDTCNVVIISGGTGCGKTTQVPQFILENACDKEEKVRVMVTQPRRIAAISIAERVAKERGEPIGTTVGYHVRLESKLSERTVLTYCTTGVLLRTLTANPNASGITHIVVDEIHEREINTDYLLIALRECLKRRNYLKLVLMSATIEGNMGLFEKYFCNQSVDIIRMESKLFDVKVFYLDQILAMCGYEPPVSPNFFAPFAFNPEDWMEEIEEIRGTKVESSLACDAKQSQFHCQEENKVSNDNTHDEWVSGEYQTADGDIIDGSTMNHFMSAVGESSTRPIMHSQTSSNSPLVSDSTELKKGFGRFTANKEVGFGFGEKHGMAETIERKFRKEMKTVLSNRQGYYHPEIDKHVANTDFSKLRLGEKYNVFFGGDFKASIDHHLLDSVLKYIADSPVFGSILVFLPGYDDIQEIMYRIDQWRGSLTNYRNTLVIPLHSQMHSIDHSEIFKPVAQDTRKIILATNIAEASITIEDVIFVVDTGKVKEKAYNYEAKLSTLTVSPISKSNAKQRSGRAGRVSNGYCIRLYSEQEFESMPETQVAEMKRVAIYDVTLHAKLFAPRGTRVVDFLSLAPEPPSVEAISQSIAFLEQVGAFYSPSRRSDADDEDIEPELTDLGRLMARLPLDPQLSRMLLFGLALKCLTPIVNLVAMLANRDPFILTTSENRDAQTRMKNQVAKTDFSDHLMLIRLCTEFCAKGLFNQQGSFCREHFLNFSTMRMANGTRRQLLQELLRAKVVSISGNRDLMTVLLDINYNSNAESWPMIQAAIAAGCYPSVGVMPPGSRLKKVQTFNERPAGLHPSSILKKQVIKLSKSPRDPRLEYVAFQELYQAPSDHALLMKMVTVIPSITALLFTGPIRLSEKIVEENDIVSENGEVGRRKSQTWDENNGIFDTNLSYFEIDTWYAVRMEKRTLTHLLRLRHKFMHFFLKGIQDPAKFRQHTLPIEEKMLHIVRELLESEHARYGFSKVVMPESAFRGFAAGYENSNGSNQNHNNSNRQGTRAPNNWRAPGRGEARDFRGKPNLAGESSNRQSTSMQRNFQQQYQPPNPTLNPQHENSGNNRPFRNGHPQQGGYNHFEHTNFPQRINYGYGRNAEIWTPQNFPHNANATGPSFQGRSSHE